MFDAAVGGLDVTARAGVVRVRDGQDTWLCTQDAWTAVAEQLTAREQQSWDMGGAEAYSLLCRKVASLSPIASINGTTRGDVQSLIEAAYDAEMIDCEDARAMGHATIGAWLAAE